MEQFLKQFEQIKEMLADYKKQVNSHLKIEFEENLAKSVLSKKHVESLHNKEKHLFEWESSLHAMKLEIKGTKDFLNKKQDQIQKQEE